MKCSASLFLTFTIVNLNCAILLAQYVILKDEPRITISSGPIKGRSVDFRGSKIYQFLNVPYGEAPINDLRFKKPIAKKP